MLPTLRFFLAIVGGRVLAAFPVLIGVSIISFCLVNVLPGSAARQLLGIEASESQVAQLEEQLGLDGSPLRRYIDWASGLLRGDLGRSIASGIPVSRLIQERLPVTLQLVTYTFLISVLTSMLVSLACFMRPSGFLSQVNLFASVGALSIPSYVLAYFLVWLLSVKAGVFPSIGYVPFGESPIGHLRSLTLPSLAMGLPLFGFYTRFLLSELKQQIGADYYVATLARGVSHPTIVVRHVLPHSIFAFANLVAVNFGTIVGGTVIVEEIFAIPGIGRLLLQSVAVRDFTTIQSIVLILSVVTITANLFADVLQQCIDPRLRHVRHA